LICLVPSSTWFVRGSQPACAPFSTPQTVDSLKRKAWCRSIQNLVAPSRRSKYWGCLLLEGFPKASEVENGLELAFAEPLRLESSSCYRSGRRFVLASGSDGKSWSLGGRIVLVGLSCHILSRPRNTKTRSVGEANQSIRPRLPSFNVRRGRQSDWKRRMEFSWSRDRVGVR